MCGPVTLPLVSGSRTLGGMTHTSSAQRRARTLTVAVAALSSRGSPP